MGELLGVVLLVLGTLAARLAYLMLYLAAVDYGWIDNPDAAETIADALRSEP